ncbi:MAG: hypothetical protein OXH81_01335 [Gemmatimonadetes bacterium]|nr:hypothetical protein [Gemmatimonadota bacterium]
MQSIIPKGIRPAYPDEIPASAVRSKLMELLGLEEISAAIDYTTESRQEEDGLCTMRVRYENLLGEAVPGILMVPQEESAYKRPGIVCVPGTGGTADEIAHPRFFMERKLMGWARELARRGFATLAISPKGCELRRSSLEEWATENKLLAPYGRTQMGVLVEETLKGARLLAAIPGVDSNRIGLTGMSLGGNATWYAMACAPWIWAGVPVCGGVGSMARVIHHTAADRHSAYYFIPHLLRHFDHAAIVAACMPPRPFMMIAPTEDEDMPREGVDELIPVVSQAYAEAGCPERFQVRQPEGNHAFLVEYFEWMADWFRLASRA